MRFTSEDGATWRWVGTESLKVTGDLYVGVVVNSHDNSTSGEASFDNLRLGAPENPRPVGAPAGSGTGLQATYFDLQSGNLVRRTDSNIDFGWDVGSPAEGIGTDLFSVRWEGFIEAPADGVHALHVRSDDGARLWLDDQLVLDAWQDQGADEKSVQVQLEAGKKYPVKLEFYERGREALIQLQWSSPAMARQPIPASQLYVTSVSGAAPQISETPDKSVEVSEQPPVDIASLLDVECRDTLANQVTGVADVCVVPRAGLVERLGRWQESGTSVYAVDRRGFVEYELNVPKAGIHQLEVEGRSHTRFDLDRNFELVLSVDGEHLGRRLLDAGFEGSGRTRILTPWLRAGPHRVRVYWDNARRGRSLEVQAVRLQALPGDDTDGDGVPDWMRSWLKERCETETGVGEPVIRSRTSPLCLEGRGRFLSMITVTVAGERVEVHAAPNDRWYADVPLSPEEPVEVEISYQNGGHRELKSLIWESTQLLEAGSISLRAGDSLLLSTCSQGTDGEDQESLRIEIESAILDLEPGVLALPYRFERPGSFAAMATSVDGDAERQTTSAHIDVIDFPLGSALAAWVGNEREWRMPSIPDGVVLEPDPGLRLRPDDPQTGNFLLTTLEAADRCVAARLKEHGPILGTTSIRGFRLYASAEANYGVVETYPDGTDLIEMGIVISSLQPEVAVEVKLVVGGVVFEDGTVVKVISPSQFNPLGEATLRFLRPALAKTSVCHKLSAYQGQVYLGGYR